MRTHPMTPKMKQCDEAINNGICINDQINEPNIVEL